MRKMIPILAAGALSLTTHAGATETARDQRAHDLVAQSQARQRHGDPCGAARLAADARRTTRAPADLTALSAVDEAARSQCTYRLSIHTEPPCDDAATRIFLRPAILGIARGLHVSGERRVDGCDATFDISAVEPATYRVEIEAEGARLVFRDIGVASRGEVALTLGPLTPLWGPEPDRVAPPGGEPWGVLSKGMILMGSSLIAAGIVSGCFAASKRGTSSEATAAAIVGVTGLGVGLGGLYLLPRVPPPSVGSEPRLAVGFVLGGQF
jgi:hypothetical protein